MKSYCIIIKGLFLFIFLTSNVVAASSSYFNDGIKLYKQKKFEKSQILFERDIAYNPKSEKSYLYLAKIFNERKNERLEEINLNNVLLLNPQNEEAIHMFINLNIKKSDYNKARELIKKFNLVCKTICSKESELVEKLNKLSPEDAKN